MKCPKCGSSDVTQSKGKCNECLWIYEKEQKKKKEKLQDIKKEVKNKPRDKFGQERSY
jgi:tRNA(Ile2) C34 agmatinyltransferase TiaS